MDNTQVSLIMHSFIHLLIRLIAGKFHFFTTKK
jgi:hypothetical protein